MRKSIYFLFPEATPVHVLDEYHALSSFTATGLTEKQAKELKALYRDGIAYATYTDRNGLVVKSTEL